MIRMPCPQCNKVLEMKEELIGRQVKCPTCGHTFQAVAPAASPPPPAAPAPNPPPAADAPRGRLPVPASVAVVVAGLVLVIFARGGDNLGARGVARASARQASAERELREKEMKRRLDSAQGDPRSSAGSDKAEDLTSLRDEVEQLTKDATAARSSDVMWAYWREWAFLLGTVVLVVGLLWTGFTATGAGRWLSLGMVGIITISLYIGGIAWIGAVASTIRGMAG